MAKKKNRRVLDAAALKRANGGFAACVIADDKNTQFAFAGGEVATNEGVDANGAEILQGETLDYADPAVAFEEVSFEKPLMYDEGGANDGFDLQVLDENGAVILEPPGPAETLANEKPLFYEEGANEASTNEKPLFYEEAGAGDDMSVFYADEMESGVFFSEGGATNELSIDGEQDPFAAFLKVDDE